MDRSADPWASLFAADAQLMKPIADLDAQRAQLGLAPHAVKAVEIAALPRPIGIIQHRRDTRQVVGMTTRTDALGRKLASGLVEAREMLARAIFDGEQAADLADP